MVNACNDGQAATDRGRQAEDAALAMLQDAGLRVLRRNFKTPGRGGGEIDVIMLEPDGTLVFVEVRHRRQMRQGGAAASVDARKQARIVWAARHYLARLRQLPPCRFDVVAFDGHWHAAHPPTPRWIRAAFDAG
jgi:putative endonuclease